MKKRKELTNKQIDLIFKRMFWPTTLINDMRNTISYQRDKCKVIGEEMCAITAEDIATSSAFKKAVASLPHKLVKAFRAEAKYVNSLAKSYDSAAISKLDKQIMGEMLQTSNLPPALIRQLAPYFGFEINDGRSRDNG